MKGSERHHLKDNELVNLLERARHLGTERKREVTWLVVVLVAVGAAWAGYAAWTSRAERRAEALMAAAVATEETPIRAPGVAPTAQDRTFGTERERLEAAVAGFKAVADQYPSTDAGLLARYREGGLWLALGKPQEAVGAYEQVQSRAGGLLRQMARLGLAEAEVRAGDYDRAIATYQDAAAAAEGSVPVEGILMQLGRAYLSAGKADEARQTFNRIIEEFPASPLSVDARREIDLLSPS
jgi:tetratricopeptide (TPR) repeat protein